MFSTGNNIVTGFAVLLSLAFIMLVLYFTNKMTGTTDDVMIKVVLNILTMLTCVYVIDTVIAFKVKLTSDENKKDLLEIIKLMIASMVAYKFATKNNK